ncbi:MAG: RtcB family protein [Phycisphaeraceae bacterium]|nr:RtcB family protein [Phycisphaeraceae bacterium]
MALKARELANLGIPDGEALRLAVRACARAAQAGIAKESLRAMMQGVIENPQGYLQDPVFDRLAAELAEKPRTRFVERDEPAPWKSWGVDLEPESVDQMARACRLPIAAAGALMPDAHVGYGLPIGGVLATRNAVVPYAVGVDIACRMRLSVLDLPPAMLESDHLRARLEDAIEKETRFGIGAAFQRKREHKVLDSDWRISHITAQHKDKAWSQLGTSGSGNHFVEFGVLTITDEDISRRGSAAAEADSGFGSGWRFDLPAGQYLALLSHSGSRGTGAAVCDYYSKLAMKQRPELPKDLSYLAWLDLDSEPGREYWNAMNLMGEYAAANHECIHRHVATRLGATIVAGVENHHNFAWLETHDLGEGPEEVVVHRKGATPAGEGSLGVIPGSMASPTFIVRGRAGPESLRSASHGAGRIMSRTQAKKTLNWHDVNRELRERGVELLSAGIDEAPDAYKDIHEVMRAQHDLVEPIARFEPRLVKMAPGGERPED